MCPNVARMKPWGKVAALSVFTLLASVFALSTPLSANTPEITQVVQLGDSYSAGYGVLADDISVDGGGCLTPGYYDTSAGPGGRLAASLGVQLVFAACGGAEIDDIGPQFNAARPHIPGDGTGTLIVFTAGGNDLRTERGEMWTDVLQRCILFDLSCDLRDQNQVANFADLRNDMIELVSDIARSAPGADIRVMGYPELMQRSPWCFGVTGVDRNEADFLDVMARSLNDTLEAAVELAAAGRSGDIRFVDVEDDFDDHGACQTERSGERYVNDTEIVLRTVSVAANSFHPTASGYDAYARALNASLPQHLRP